MEKISNSYENTIEIAKEFSKTLKSGDIILMYGDLGAGKTCFVNGVLEGFGYTDGGSSPTFTIVNEYPSSPSVNHFDLYRINNEDELFEIGFFEYLESDRINIIEWPDRAKKILDEFSTIKIEITHTDNENERIIKIDKDISL